MIPLLRNIGAFLWQSSIQCPHPLHFAACTSLLKPDSIIIACSGHSAMQAPQPIHFSGLIYAFIISPYSVISHAAPQHGYITLTSHSYYSPYTKRVQNIFQGSAPAAFCPSYRTFLFSAPGVVTITFSGVITSAPFAVAAPLNIFSTIALNVSTTAPSVTYSATPLIW